jgi:starch-binding outer membrane protein SusE/F
MKKSNLLLSLIVAVAFMAFTSSCKKETVVPPSAGIPVADGFYFALVGQDPVATAQLTTASVDAPSISSMAREGFVQGYAYLTAGSYNMVEIKDKAVINTYGGAAQEITDGNPECDVTSYSLITATVDGAAFTIPNDGLYVMAYDATQGEIVYDEITSVGIIGDGTEGGWSTDKELTEASLSAEGGSWGATDVLLKQGVMKFRFNCRWAIDRRIDKGQDFDNANGYSFFTNYGNDINNLLPGNEGPNIPITERALFTVTFSWDPLTGVSATMVRTGDAPPIVFDPADWNWGIIGSVTANAFDSDQDMYYKGEDAGTYTWVTVVSFTETASDAGNGGTTRFKFRTNDDWGTNLGGTLSTTESNLSFGAGDIASPGAGDYYIVLQTSDNGVTWSAVMTVDGWGIIGTGSPTGNWDVDADMTAAVDIVNGVETYTLTGDFTAAGEWKFRAGNDWAFNLGDDGAGGLKPDGGNLTVPSDGNYTVVLTYDGSTYSYVATKN